MYGTRCGVPLAIDFTGVATEMLTFATMSAPVVAVSPTATALTPIATASVTVAMRTDRMRPRITTATY